MVLALILDLVGQRYQFEKICPLLLGVVYQAPNEYSLSVYFPDRPSFLTNIRYAAVALGAIFFEN